MKAKKSLGQNFLQSDAVLAAIVSAAELSDNDVVLEIGPGRGALTRALLATHARVIAIEKDDDLFAALQKTFPHEIARGQLELIHGDILEIQPTTCGLQQGHYKLVANIPYNITGEIIRMFLSGTSQPERMVLLVQKEVAERIVVHDGKESILSISVKVFGTPTYVATVPAESFSPQPKVYSAIITMTNISRAQLPREAEDRFFRFVKQGFSQKRKQLVSTLAPLISRDALVSFLTTRHLLPTARAEELSVEDWLMVAK